MVYPCYVESYVTSALVSLDIFFAEANETGTGFALYEALVRRGESEMGFEERLESVGIDSPFLAGKVTETANAIFRYFTGYDYYLSGDV